MKKQNFIFLIGGVVLFLLVGVGAKNGFFDTFDTSVYTAIKALPKTVVEPIFMFMTNFGNPSFCVGMILVLWIVLYKSYGKYIVGVGLIDVILNQSLKYIFCRPRPSVEHLVHASGYSFPSGHTMIAMMLYGFFLYLLYKKANGLFKYVGMGVCIILMLCIPISRIYVGVHFASDILGGAIIGCTALYAYLLLVKEKLENM